MTIFLSDPNRPYAAKSRQSKPSKLKEASFAENVLENLALYFDIHSQVTGTHPTGKRLRVDAIAVPKDRHNWKRQDVALCIEFKSPNNSRHRNETFQIIKQCVDYSCVEWDGFGIQPIFFCPGFKQTKNQIDYPIPGEPITGSRLKSKDTFEAGEANAMMAFMGQNNVGELIHLPAFGWGFWMNGWHCIWAENSPNLGVRVIEGKRNSLTRKIGSH